MSSFFRYPGGKGKLSQLIVQHLNELVPLAQSNILNTDSVSSQIIEYREPFFGGGSVGLNYLPQSNAKTLWINDLDLGIKSIWYAILNDHEKLKELIKSFIPTPKDFNLFKTQLINSQNSVNYLNTTELAFKKLAIHQISYSGLGTKSGGPLGGVSQKSNYKIDCRWSPIYINKKIDAIHNLLKNYNTQITSNDFEYIINKESNNAVIIYLDPPYFDKGEELYQCSFNNQDHIRLANTLKNTNHKWLLSYDDCKEIRDLYNWATIKTVNVNYTIKTSRTKSELLIMK